MKRPTSFFIVLIILNAQWLSAQNYIDYYNLANEAEYQFVEGDLITAKNIFINLEGQFYELKPLDNFYLGMINYFLGDTINGHKYLLKSAGSGFATSDFAKGFQKKFPVLNISEKTSSQVSFLEEQLLQKKDQRIVDTLRYFKGHYDLYAPDRSLDDGQDKELQAQFLQFLEQNGIPNLYLYGDYEIAFITRHIETYPDSILYRRYKDFHFNEIIKGNIGPYYYCQLVDRNLSSDMDTFYGTDLIKSSERTGQKEIISHRKEIGLSIYYDGPGQLRPRYRRFQN